jgi:hypothetical protein
MAFETANVHPAVTPPVSRRLCCRARGDIVESAKCGDVETGIVEDWLITGTTPQRRVSSLQDMWTRPLASLLLDLAREICRVVSAANALIHRNLRIGTKRAGHVNGAAVTCEAMMASGA